MQNASSDPDVEAACDAVWRFCFHPSPLVPLAVPNAAARGFSRSIDHAFGGRC